MCGWLFKRFEQRIKRILREHVHLVNQIHFVTPRSRHVFGILDELAHVVHARIAGRIDFEQVDKPPSVDFLTGGTDTTRRC